MMKIMLKYNPQNEIAVNPVSELATPHAFTVTPIVTFPGAVDRTAIPAAISHCSGIASSRFSIPGIRHLPVSLPDGFFSD